MNDDPAALADAMAAAAVLGAALARFENALDRLRGPLTAFAAVAGRGVDDDKNEHQRGDQGQQD